MLRAVCPCCPTSRNKLRASSLARRMIPCQTASGGDTFFFNSSADSGGVQNRLSIATVAADDPIFPSGCLTSHLFLLPWQRLAAADLSTKSRGVRDESRDRFRRW